MRRGTVGRICIVCGQLFTPTAGTSRCAKCERGRSAERPWYKNPSYKEMQRRCQFYVGYPCPRCKVAMNGRHRPSVDHITPIAQGGPWEGPFQIVCLPCNVSKGSS